MLKPNMFYIWQSQLRFHPTCSKSAIDNATKMLGAQQVGAIDLVAVGGARMH